MSESNSVLNENQTDTILTNLLSDSASQPAVQDFSQFSSLFATTRLPYSQNFNALWDGQLFFNENLQDYNYDDSYIDYGILDEWILPFQNELTEKVKNVEKGLRNRDDRWYSIHAGITFTEDSLDHYLIHFYEKTSEINGAYWYSYLLSFDKKNNLTACQSLGREGLYTFTIMEDNDDFSFWQRQTDIEELSIQINSSQDITSCTNSRTEIEGDLTQEQNAQINQINIIQDSTITWMEIRKKECKTFSIN